MKNMNTVIKTNPLEFEPINKLIVKMSVPLMLSMLIQAFYNVVDSIFVSHYSQIALTAVSLAFPFQSMMIAVAIGTAVGMLSLLSRKLGEKDIKTAHKVAEAGIFLESVSYILFFVLGIVILKPFFKLFTSEQALLKQTIIYTRICALGSFGFFLSVIFERIMQATGDAFHPMLSQAVGALTNIILDPIFIFVFDLGVTGAAIATVLGQFVSLFTAYAFLRQNKHLDIKFKIIKPEKALVKEIYKVGFPSIIMQALGSLFVSILNSLLITFSTVAVSVFGIYFKLQSFIFMPVFGINNGITSIIAYNYGAKNKERMIKTLTHSLFITLFIMGIGVTVFMLFPSFLLSMFAATDEMLSIGIPALRTISLCFLPAAVSIVLISSFQATGFGIASMFVSLIRQIIVLLPMAFILSPHFGLMGIWSSFLIAEAFGLMSSISFFIYNYNKRIKPLEMKNQQVQSQM